MKNKLLLRKEVGAGRGLGVVAALELKKWKGVNTRITMPISTITQSLPIRRYIRKNELIT